jgi:hypothetical protein
MNNKELIFVDDNEPKIFYTPYIYSKIVECSNHCIIFNHDKTVKVIMKDRKGNKK